MPAAHIQVCPLDRFAPVAVTQGYAPRPQIRQIGFLPGSLTLYLCVSGHWLWPLLGQLCQVPRRMRSQASARTCWTAARGDR